MFRHTPSTLVMLWLAVSVPLVLWDAGYVLLRPHSMPGGKWHSPVWTPYELYGRVDYIYGWPALEARNGFTAAQTLLNLVETAGYVWYLATVWRHGAHHQSGRVVVPGTAGATALLVVYSASVMTVSKTALYWLNEACSGFANIGHNDWQTLLFLWILPNGLWLVFPSYAIVVSAAELLRALRAAKTD